ncbi:MAG: sugar phosphate isomerase/epimerase family protein [Bryobacteraceae bacterium]
MDIRTTRRELIGGAAAAMAALRTAGAATTPATHSEDLKLGVASYSFRKFSRADAIKGILALNVSYVNVKDFHLAMKSTPDEIAAAKKDFEDAGIKILGVGNVSFAKNDESEMKRNFEYAKQLGAPLIVMAPTMETLPFIEKMVKEYNIKAAIHNHGPEDKHFPSPESVLSAVKNMDPRMGLCMDIGHSVRAGSDIIAAAKEAGPRLHDMHVKDLKNLSDKDSQVPVGDGVIPIVALFKQLKKMNYKGGVMLEYEVQADAPLPGMQKSFAYMRGVLDGLKG